MFHRCLNVSESSYDNTDHFTRVIGIGESLIAALQINNINDTRRQQWLKKAVMDGLSSFPWQL